MFYDNLYLKRAMLDDFFKYAAASKQVIEKARKHVQELRELGQLLSREIPGYQNLHPEQLTQSYGLLVSRGGYKPDRAFALIKKFFNLDRLDAALQEEARVDKLYSELRDAMINLRSDKNSRIPSLIDSQIAPIQKELAAINDAIKNQKRKLRYVGVDARTLQKDISQKMRELREKQRLLDQLQAEHNRVLDEYAQAHNRSLNRVEAWGRRHENMMNAIDNAALRKALMIGAGGSAAIGIPYLAYKSMNRPWYADLF